MAIALGVVLLVGIGVAQVVRSGAGSTQPRPPASVPPQATPSVAPPLRGSDARLVDLRTGKVSKLPTAIANVPFDCCYSASHDGTQIAFVGAVDEGTGSLVRYALFLAERDGSGLRPLVTSMGDPPHHWGDARGLAIGTPSWSSDGTQIIYAVDGGRGVASVDVATGVSTTVTDRHGYEGPTFSADGRTILFTRAESVWTVPAVGGEETRLIPQGTSGTYSPDGDTIAYTKLFPAGGYLGIWLADAYGGHRRAGPTLYSGGPMGFLTDPEAVRRSRAAWSPDGTRIAASMFDGSPVVVVDLTTKRSRTVAASGLPVWLDDHELIIEHYEPGGFQT